MKNLIGSLAEDFHYFETSALSNQKMSSQKIVYMLSSHLSGNPGLHVRYFRVPSYKGQM